MPYPNEHSARLADPGKFVRFRRENNKLGEGIDAIFGITESGDSEIQAIRFSSEKFSLSDVKSWLKDHNHKELLLEEASRKDSADVIEVDRCDYVSKAIGSVKKTDDGYLQGVAPIAKVGIMKYRLADGTLRREFVPPETLFESDSMDSLKLKPMTNQHPPEISIDSKTVKRRQVGSTGENIAKSDGVFLTTSLVLTDKKMIDNVDSGQQELSPGYKVSVLLEPGTYKGQNYDAIQVKRRYNHVAVVDTARGGADLRLHIDNEDRFDGFIDIDQNDDSPSNNNPKEDRMVKVTLNKIAYDAEPEVANHIDAQDKKIEELQAKVDELTSEKDKVQAKLDSAEEEKTKADEKRQDDIDKAVESRLALVTVAKDHLDEDTKIDEMSDKDITLAVIAKAFPDRKLDGKSDGYIEGAFESAVEVLSKKDGDGDGDGDGDDDDGSKSDGIKNQRRNDSGKKTGDGDGEDKVDSDESHKNMVKRMTNGYKRDDDKK